MKKKYLTKTYLREAVKYNCKLFLDEDDYYVSLKELIHLTEPFIINNGVTAMDDGYYIIEMVPKTGHQALRIFLNDKKEIVEYYFDIIKESGITEENVPYYKDLYLDVTIQKNGDINILDEDELEQALKEEKITNEEYNLAIEEKNKLLEEIKNNTNKLLNKDISRYLKGE